MNFIENLSDEEVRVKDYLDRFTRGLREMKEKDSEIMDNDPVFSGLLDLADLANSCNQYQSVSIDDFVDTLKVCLIRLKLSRKEIESMFGIKPVNVYGMGLFVPIEGILLSPSLREKMNYDSSLSGKRGSYFDTSSVPREVYETHEFRLAIPAMRGLFVPKKSRLTSWIGSTRCIKYFELTIS